MIIERIKDEPGTEDRGRSLVTDESGLTLVELMIVMVLIGIISGGLLALLIDSQKLFAVSQHFAESQDHARIGIDRMSKDIRQSEWKRMLNTISSAYEIRFWQYFDDEKKLKMIGYRLNSGSTTLERYIDNNPYDSSAGTYTPVANYIQNRFIGPTPVFTYHLPESVGITLLVDPDRTKVPSYITLNATVEPRNQYKQEW